MSQHAARHDPRATSAAEDDDDPQVRQQPGRPAVRTRRAADDDGVSPEPAEPDEEGLELIGGDDLSAADLGPAAPDARDPDADSGRIRKIAAR